MLWPTVPGPPWPLTLSDLPNLHPHASGSAACVYGFWFLSFIFFTLSCPNSLFLHSKAGFWHDFYQVQLIPRGASRTQGNTWLRLRRTQVAARPERCVDRYGGVQTSLLSPCALRSQRSPACAQPPECSVTAVPQRAFKSRCHSIGTTDQIIGQFSLLFWFGVRNNSFNLWYVICSPDSSPHSENP